MSNHRVFGDIPAEKQKQYQQEIREKYGDEKVDESNKRWGSYSEAKKQTIIDEGNTIYADLAANIGKGPESAEVQKILARWHQHLSNFYEPTPEILRGLGQMYNTHPDFIANFRKLHPDLPAFLEEAIAYYCDNLEAAS